MMDKVKMDFTKGLLPTVVLDRATGDVLMLAFSSRESLKLTMETGFAHFFSRSRNRIWRKGEESGNSIKVMEVFSDCDDDSIIFRGEPSGPSCHTGKGSCFFKKILSFDGEQCDVIKTELTPNILLELQEVLRSRKLEPKRGSYSSELFGEGLEKILHKISEEVKELCDSASAGFRGSPGEKNSVVWETADLIFHVLALLVFLDIPLEEVLSELARRRDGR